MILGIDVSDNNGKIVWDQVVQKQVQFAYIKTSEGATLKEQTFIYNRAGAKAVGIIVGAYHYYRPRDTGDQNADNFLEALGSLGADELPCALDLEVDDGFSPGEILPQALTFLQRVNAATGKRPIIYFNKAWAAKLWAFDPDVGAAYPAWFADPVPVIPTIPFPWRNWLFWQYAWKAKIDGISGDCDLNQFNGSIEQLRALAGT